MNVLVTGGLGYIGSHTCLALHEMGITPIIFDNLSNASVNVLEHLAAISGSTFAFIQGDVRDKSSLSSVMDDFAIEGVFHFAALKSVGESTQLPLNYYQNNVAGTLTLLEAMSEQQINKLIFSSSATVYGDPDYLPVDEHHPIRATNPYGWTKAMTEQVLKDYCTANANMLAISLRYFNPIGAHPSGQLGESPRGIPNNLMPYIAQTAVGKRDVLRVFGNDYDTPDGTGVRDYIHIMDLAAGHVRAFTRLTDLVGFHAFNLGTGEGYSVFDVIKAFERASGVTIPVDVVARRPGDIACNYANAEKAQRILGWQAQLGLLNMAEDTWRWQSNYPNGFE